MKRLLFFLSFGTVIMSTHAQSEIKAYGDNPKAGYIIQGVVRDSVGPLDAFICEKNDKNEEVEFTFADLNGHFSFKLVSPADSIEVRRLGYYPITAPITKNHYDITLLRDPQISEVVIGGNTVRDRTSFWNDEKYPLLLLNGSIMESDSTKWSDIDYSKDTYDKKEIAHLFGIEVDIIKHVNVLKGEDAVKKWGSRAKNGSIEVKTKELK